MDDTRIKLLLVEDDEEDYIIARDLISEIEGPKYELQWAESYEKGLEAISRLEHDVYLFDYRLGAHTGLDLLQEAVKRGCKAPMILFTGQGGKEIDLGAMKAGASDYLVKGKIDAAVLERTIRYAIERKRTEERIRHLAYYDQLTDLPNRAFFQELLTRAIKRQPPRLAAVMFLDLDNFKRINDTLGHNVGDELLKGVAARLNACLRKSDVVTQLHLEDAVSRLGGDEFTVLLTDLRQEQDAADVGRRICDALSHPFTLQGHEVVVTTSIGITLYPKDGDNLHVLLKNADVAMYHAKAGGRNNYQLYNPSMNTETVERLNLEQELRAALERQEFLLYYQPRIEIATGAVVGMEALIRWQHPKRGLISPGEFIPVAEETGLIMDMGKWVLQTACAQNKAWQEAGLAPIRVSVNLSNQQFKQRDLVNIVVNALETSGLAPEYLELEIMERIMMQDKALAKRMLHELHEIGVRLSMDDFGMGYSSISNLKSFPLDLIKIDHSFVKEMAIDADAAAIVSSIIAMAKSLKLRLSAESIETEAQLAMLREQGCDEAQGHLFSRALSVEEARAFLANGQAAGGAGQRSSRAGARPGEDGRGRVADS